MRISDWSSDVCSSDLLTFGLTIFIDLTVAIAVGVTLASLLFMMRMSRTVEIASDSEGAASDAAEEALDQRTASPAGVEVFLIDGPIFFGVANDLMEPLSKTGRAPVWTPVTNAPLVC